MKLKPAKSYPNHQILISIHVFSVKLLAELASLSIWCVRTVANIFAMIVLDMINWFLKTELVIFIIAKIVSH